MKFLDSFFKITERKSSTKVEILAGISTFLAISYIILVCPSMISNAMLTSTGDPAYATQVYNAVFFATCFSAFIGTMLMALIANLPFAQASGMGLIGFFTYTIILSMGYSYAEALVFVFLSGIVFIVITLAGIREHIIRAIPKNVKIAISGGIGLFIAYLGLRNAGIVVNADSTGVTLVDFSAILRADAGPRNLAIGAAIAFLGVLIIVVLNHFKIKGTILIAIGTCTVLGAICGLVNFDMNMFDNFGSTFVNQWNDYIEIGFMSVFKGFGTLFAGKDFIDSLLIVIMIVLTFSLVNMFDAIGTFLGTARKANLIDEKGNMHGIRRALLCDAIGTTAGAMLGGSTVTTVVESSVGIGEGGRTGFSSVITAILFLVAIPLLPIISIVPGFATAPALIFVGVLMLSGIVELDFNNITELFPAFMTIAFMPFTASIANGIAFGLISYTVIKLVTLRFKDLHPLTVVLSILFILRFILLSV